MYVSRFSAIFGIFDQQLLANKNSYKLVLNKLQVNPAHKTSSVTIYIPSFSPNSYFKQLKTHYHQIPMSRPSYPRDYYLPTNATGTCDSSINQTISQIYAFFLLVFSSIVLLVIIVKLALYVVNWLRDRSSTHRSKASSENYYAISNEH